MNDPFFTALNDVIKHVRLPDAIPRQELADARTWARKQGYRFWWLIDPSEALDCLCAMRDKDGKTVREWVGGCAYDMPRDERTDVESRLSWEQRQDTGEA